MFGGSAWTFDEVRGEYYLHQFLPEQPDLNVRNAEVRKELDDVLLFWLDKKVDGFRIDALAHLFEVEDLSKDEPSTGKNLPEVDMLCVMQGISHTVLNRFWKCYILEDV